MVSRNVVILAVIMVAAAIVAAAALTMNQPTDKGRLVVLVKDAPAEWRYVNVTFSQVQVHKADTANDSWISVDIEHGEIDLASLTNVSEMLAAANITAGKYTQIRIVVSDVVGTMTNGTVVHFDVPSGELKTTHPFNITPGSTLNILIEIDLEHSIEHNASGWKFKPVLGAVSEGS